MYQINTLYILTLPMIYSMKTKSLIAWNQPQWSIYSPETGKSYKSGLPSLDLPPYTPQSWLLNIYQHTSLRQCQRMIRPPKTAEERRELQMEGTFRQETVSGNCMDRQGRPTPGEDDSADAQTTLKSSWTLGMMFLLSSPEHKCKSGQESPNYVTVHFFQHAE